MQDFAIGAFGTFGSPKGFQQITYSNELQFDENLDLKPAIIELVPNSEIFSVKKHLLNNKDYLICFAIYTYAKEAQSSRQGTFIGSFIVFKNCVGNINYIYTCLRQFHEIIINNPQNIIQNVLQVSDIEKIKVGQPSEALRLQNTINRLNETTNNIGRDKILITIENKIENYQTTIVDFFTKAIKAPPNINTLYFTINEEIVKNTKKNNLINIYYIDNSNSINKLQNKTTPQIKNNQLDQQKNFSWEQNRYNQTTKEVKNIQNHETEYSLNTNLKTNNEITIRLWHHSWPIGQINIPNLIQEHNQLVKAYQQLTNFKNIANQYDESEVTQKQIQNFLKNRFKAVIIILLALTITIFSISIYWYINYKKPQQSYQTNENQEKNNPQKNLTSDNPQNTKNTETPKVGKLEPPPNSKLEGTDLQNFNNAIKRSMKIEDIVKVALAKNPNDIQKTYGNQQKELATYIIEENKDCFSNTILVCDKIENIPTYKKQ